MNREDTVSDFADQTPAVSELGLQKQTSVDVGLTTKTFGRAVTAYSGNDNPKLKHAVSQAHSVGQRSFIGRAHPCLSPINTRRTAKERSEAKQRTQDKKRLMKIKRDNMAVS